jgi:micrococcal nuclease
MKTRFEYEATVYNVYDGDTFKAIVDLGFSTIVKHTFRLYGVDTPEMRGPEKVEGKKVRDYVRGLILNKDITIITHRDKTGKYGRYLAEVVFTDDEGNHVDLAAHLLEKKMAKELNYK